MKLLLDENLSRRIVPFLQAFYPGRIALSDGTVRVVLAGIRLTSVQKRTVLVNPIWLAATEV